MTAMVDLSKLFGLSWVLDAETEDDVDATLRTATVRLAPRLRLLNMSPLVFDPEDSLIPGPLNDQGNRFNPLNYDATPLLQAGRRIVIETATLPLGATRELADQLQAWDVEFDGEITDVTVGDNDVTVSCAPRALQKTWIEPDPATGGERVYGTVGGTAIEGELQQLVDDNDPSKYSVLNIDDSGASNAIEVQLFAATTVGRGKPIDIGAGDDVYIEGTTNYDGEHALNLLEANHTDEEVLLQTTTAGAFAAETTGTLWSTYGYKGGKPELWVPSATMINAYEWLQSMDRDVLSALQEAMAEFGWSVKQAFDDERQMLRWKIFNPSTSEEVGTIMPFARFPTSGVRKTGDDTRNINVVEFGNVAAEDNLGLERKYVESAVDKASVQLFGRLYSRIGVASTGLVKQSTEASDLATRVVTDLADEAGEITIELRHNVAIEPGDTCKLGPESAEMIPLSLSKSGTLSNTLEYGIQRVRQRMGRVWRSELTLRDAAAPARRQRHFDVIQDAGYVASTGVLGPAKPAAPTVDVLSSSAPTLVEVSWAYPTTRSRAWDTMEVHVSASSGFAPSALTLRPTTRSTYATVRRLAAGTWYCRIVPRDSLGNAGEASDETSFTI